MANTSWILPDKNFEEHMLKEFSYQEGDGYAFQRHISADEVRQFAEIVGDLNPVHLDAGFAENSFFKKRIVHGAFLAGLISKVLGMDFPGPGTIYISQNSVFKRPVYVDTTVSVDVKVTQVIPEKHRLVLDTTIRNADGELCLAGSATVWLP
jgi:3-hydroxybutyryl-CoA dehydratase